MALALGGAGAKLALVSRNKEQLQAVAAEARKLGAEADIFVTDVTSEDQVKQLERDVAAKFGKVQILINNAGINIRKPSVEFTLDDWRAVMDTNLTSVFLHLSRVCAVHERQGYGAS